MPSKLGFGNTRKKSSPALYGSAKHYKNPIQKKMETLPGVDTKLDAKNPIRKSAVSNISLPNSPDLEIKDPAENLKESVEKIDPNKVKDEWTPGKMGKPEVPKS